MSLASAVEPHADQIVPLGYLFEDAFGGPPTVETAADPSLSTISKT